MANLFSRTSTYFASKIRSYDKYAIPISLHYKGEDSFKSILGGLASYLILCITTIYAIILMITMSKHGDSVINSMQVVTDLSYDSTSYFINNGKFVIGAYAFDDTDDILNNASYVKVTAEQITVVLDAVSGTQISYTATPLTVSS